MVVVKVTRNYQITIPAGIRERIGIREGDYVEVEVEGEKIVIRRVGDRRKRVRLGKKLSVEEIEESIERGLKGCVR